METFPVYDQSGQRLSELGGLRLVKYKKADGTYGYTTAPYSASGGASYVGDGYDDPYTPIRAETSALNESSLRYAISVPIPWKLDGEGGVHDFYVIAISKDGAVVENVSSVYLSYDRASLMLAIAPLFGETDFCVYIFRNEQAINLFSLKSDGHANIAAILAQFEKDNRVLKQLQALAERTIHTPDKMAILPEARFRANKVLAFDEKGQPALWLSTEDIQSVYAARDEAQAILEQVKQERQAALADMGDKGKEIFENVSAVERDMEGIALRVSEDKKASETARNSAQGYASSAKSNAEKSLAAFEGAVDAADSAEADAQKVGAASANWQKTSRKFTT